MHVLGRWSTIALAAVLAILVLPDLVAACPVCFDARDENRRAFLATTVFLSAFPLGMVAGAGMWLKKRARDLDAEELAERQEREDLEGR